MISKEQARSLCDDEINRPDGYWPDKPELVVVEIVELPEAWVVYYQSRAFLESGNFSDRLVGNGPYVVCKISGRFAIAGSAPPIELRIQEALNSIQRV